ncbi:MAG: SRPBCC family protein [Chloroflexi bacterium]|nr:SRPBCC family protein [Chloroflexota bacterium]
MIQFEHSIQINRPVHTVFEFLADPRNFSKWQSGVVQSTITSPGPIRLGTTFDEVVKIMGRKVHTSCEITQHELDSKICFRATSRPIAYAGQFSFEGTGESTRLTVYGAVQLRGLWRIAEPLFGPEVKKESTAELRKIKEIVESGALAHQTPSTPSP